MFYDVDSRVSSRPPLLPWAGGHYDGIAYQNEHALLSQEPKIDIANKDWRFTRVTFFDFAGPPLYPTSKIYERKGDSHMAASF